MKALVAADIRTARRFMRFLELDQNEWVPLSPGSALVGHRFTKVLVLPLGDPEMRSGVESEMLREWFLHLTKVKILPQDQENVLHV